MDGVVLAIEEAGEWYALVIGGTASIGGDEGGGEGVGFGEVHIDIGSEDEMFVPVFGVLGHFDEVVGFGDLEGSGGLAVAAGIGAGGVG